MQGKYKMNDIKSIVPYTLKRHGQIPIDRMVFCAEPEVTS